MKKSIKFLIYVIALSFVFCAVFPAFTATSAYAASTDETLVVYNWEDYIGEGVIHDFENYYRNLTGKNIKVIYSTFDTNETAITTITRGDSVIDLLCPSEYAIQKLIDSDMLMSFTEISAKANVTYSLNNKENINPVIYQKVANANIDIADYFVPYMWGTLGILYNADVVTEEDLATGWALLWNKNQNSDLNNKILMKDSVRDAYAAAVLYLKQEGKLEGTPFNSLSVEELINCTDDALLTLAKEALIAQKDVLKGYEVDFGKDDLIKGKAYVDLAWSGDALYAIEEAAEEDVNLKYYIPEIGGNIWFDGWVVPKSAQNLNAALMFIDYMCRPDIGTRNMMEIGYSSAVNASVIQADADALAVLTENDYDIEEYFSNETRYPDTNSAALGIMKDFGDRNDIVNAMWEEVKANGKNTWLLIGIIAAVVVAVGGAIAAIAITKKKSNRRIKA